MSVGIYDVTNGYDVYNARIVSMLARTVWLLCVVATKIDGGRIGDYTVRAAKFFKQSGSAVTCNPLPRIEFGTWYDQTTHNHAICTSSALPVGHRCTLQCMPGYVVHHWAAQRCSSTGVWIGYDGRPNQLPFCTAAHICRLPAEAGRCTATQEQWYYNEVARQCDTFTYGGCGGNENRFDTRVECEKQCLPKAYCQLAASVGPCPKQVVRWFYNRISGTCDQFVYGGCDGNSNRFTSKSSCEERCIEKLECRVDQIEVDCRIQGHCTPTCTKPNPVCTHPCTRECRCPNYTPISHNGRCIEIRACADCMGGQVWTACQQKCPVTCQRRYRSTSGICATYGKECMPGCGCPSEKPVWQDGRCITLTECPPKSTLAGACHSSTCLNGGTCEDKGSTFNCKCAAGFRGTHCEDDTAGPCASRPCQRGGKCFPDQVFGFKCYCPQGATGRTCERAYTCDESPCLHGGTCKNGDIAYTCKCAIGFVGHNCEQEISVCATLGPCRNEATCEDTANRFECHCAHGFSGELCEIDINECASNPCVNGGSCVNKVAKYDCRCPINYLGTNCQHVSPYAPPTPKSKSLRRHALLDVYLTMPSTDDDGSEPRPCPPGLEWTACGMPCNITCQTMTSPCTDTRCVSRCQCPSVKPVFGPDGRCIAMEECDKPPAVVPAAVVSAGDVGDSAVAESPVSGLCARLPCLHGGTCMEVSTDNRICFCEENVLGVNCEKTAAGSHLLACGECLHGGRCVEDKNGIYCFCAKGTSGDHCEIVDSLHCSGGQILMDCGQACTPTCAHPHPLCPARCVHKCACPATIRLWHHDQCIAVDQCPPESQKPCTGGSEWIACAPACTRTCREPRKLCDNLRCIAKCHCPHNAPLWHQGRCIRPSECLDVLRVKTKLESTSSSFSDVLWICLIGGAVVGCTVVLSCVYSVTMRTTNADNRVPRRDKMVTIEPRPVEDDPRTPLINTSSISGDLSL